MARAITNMSVPMTLACGGTPRRDAVHTYSGNVFSVPELKFVMMKSSNERAKASKAAAAIPGATSGNVTLRKVYHSLA